MRAVICDRYGPPEGLRLGEVEPRPPGPGEVRVAVKACGVNFADTLIIEGRYQLRPEPPFTPGTEVAGTVAEVGEDVTVLAPGDRVVGMTGYGGFAETVTVEASALIRAPDSVDPTVAAGLAVTYGTSIHALVQRGALRAGETLLVLGAGGGVGLAAVEIGKAMGARVIAAASTAEKLEAAREAGADDLVAYGSEPLKDRVKALTQGRGADVVYDPVGGDLFEQAVRATARGGRALVVGFAGGTITKLPMNLLLLKECAALGVFWGNFRRFEPEAEAANFARLFAWLEEGRIRPRLDRVLPLERAPEALRALIDRKVIGKIVLRTAAG